ncbi:NADAR family protein [Streptacidiphilus sp. N1-3]|uniref:NADAR family protein n=1 Tax=Streptacidiphilus alkalitolerans TaxID=3342712 RepID=A0ABV6WU77_9ACTN
MTTSEVRDPARARSREELAGMTAAGARPKWLMFWGHQPQPDRSVGPGCLSQWWPSRFSVDGVEYATAEHWMMAGKARLFGDGQAVPGILAARTPAEAKNLGRLVRGFDDERWRVERFELVVAGNVAKFGQDPALRAYLLGTANRVLVEASPRDQVWGIGLGAANERATDPARWRGQNLLGFALMEARARLTADQDPRQERPQDV